MNISRVLGHPKYSKIDSRVQSIHLDATLDLTSGHGSVMGPMALWKPSHHSWLQRVDGTPGTRCFAFCPTRTSEPGCGDQPTSGLCQILMAVTTGKILYSDPENFEYHWRKNAQTVTLQSSPSSNQTWLPVAGKSTI